MEEKSNKKKKAIIIALIIIVVVVFTPIFAFPKGYIRYGSDKCEGHRGEGSLSVMGHYVCGLCLTPQRATSAPTPEICRWCSLFSFRCKTCGKLL